MKPLLVCLVVALLGTLSQQLGAQESKIAGISDANWGEPLRVRKAVSDSLKIPYRIKDDKSRNMKILIEELTFEKLPSKPKATGMFLYYDDALVQVALTINEDDTKERKLLYAALKQLLAEQYQYTPEDHHTNVGTPDEMTICFWDFTKTSVSLSTSRNTVDMISNPQHLPDRIRRALQGE